MIHRLVLRNLAHRPIRTGLTILALAVEVMMIVMMTGVSEGLLQETLRRTRGVGADILVRPEITGATISGADISDKLPGMLMERYPQISQVMGSTVFTPGNLQTITGVDWEELSVMSGGIAIFEGRTFQDSFEAVIDEVYAEQEEIGVGETIMLMGHEFEVSGIVETGKMSRVFIPLKTMAELQGWQGRYSQVYVKLHDPALALDLIEELRALLPDHHVVSVEAFLANTATNVRHLSSQFVNVIIAIAVVIGFIVVMLAMYTAILERTKEIGILKAIGASKAYVCSVVLRETVAVSAVGIVLGYGLSVLGQRMVAVKYPLIPVLLIPGWMVWAAALTIVGAIGGAMYPALKAARADPCEILTYE